MNQSLVISPSGAISGLQLKGAGVDLRKLGKASISRISDIVWCEASQRWQVKFLRGTLAGQRLLDQAGIPLEYEEYDDAVRAEIDFVNNCINKGQRHMVGLADIRG
jgi:hypothetical protein